MSHWPQHPVSISGDREEAKTKTAEKDVVRIKNKLFSVGTKERNQVRDDNESLGEKTW